MVRIHPDPPGLQQHRTGAVAQLGERLLCKQEVVGSIPSSSTRPADLRSAGWRRVGMGGSVGGGVRSAQRCALGTEASVESCSVL